MSESSRRGWKGLRAVAPWSVFVAGLAAGSPLARAQEGENESSPQIELGSSRIGGPGLTDRERRRVQAAYAPDPLLTEATLPKPGHPKRIPGLHILAERHYGGDEWKEACRFYDMIIEEGGEGGLDVRDGARAKVARSNFGYAQAAFRADDLDEVERRLSQAEKFGYPQARIDVLRRKVAKDGFRSKLAAGDVVGARKLYDRYQSLGQPDEDERIWFGEQLATMAKEAKSLGDDLAYRDVMGMLEEVAPLNRDYRALRAEESGTEAVFRNIAVVLVGAVAIVALLSLFSSWRARSRVGADGTLTRRKKNPFLDDDDDL